MDVVWSTADEAGNTYGVNRTDIRLQAAVAALSAGPVGFGDGPGYADFEVVMSTCAGDGTLLGPSVPATPIDAMLDGVRSPTTNDGVEPEVCVCVRARAPAYVCISCVVGVHLFAQYENR